MKPKSARFPVPKSRYEMFSDAAVQNWKRIGREDAIRIAKARKGDDSAWFNVNRYTLKKVFPELCQRLLEIWVKDWENTPWESEPWYKPDPWHYCHVSTVDATKVAYYPTLQHLLDRREIRTRPGRYLTKYFPDQDAKSWAERMSNRTIHFVEDDDPEGWEWVYEHGHNFTSCMVYKRDGRYLAHGMYDLNHPVRAYAYPGNGLRLAWIGAGFKSEDGKVFARSIVMDNKYLRIYGDDSIVALLEAQGFEEGAYSDFHGVKLNRRDTDEGIICPYLDCGDVEIHDDYLEIVRSGVSTSSRGLLQGAYCDDCGNIWDDDELTWVGLDDDSRVCEHCLSRDYSRVIGRNGCEYFINNVRVIEVDGNYYDSNYLSDNAIDCCCECGEHRHSDNLYGTKDGDACGDCCTYLNYEDDEGNSCALNSKVAEDPDGKTFHEDEGKEDAVTEEVWHESAMLELASGEFVHPSTLREYPERFLRKDDDEIFLVPEQELEAA